MSFLLNKTFIASHFRSHSQYHVLPLFSIPFRRRFDPRISLSLEHSGRALSHAPRLPHRTRGSLESQDPALKRFKSHKKSVNAVKRMGDVLTLVVVAGCCYEIYVRAVMREEARKKAGAGGGSA